jgi:2-polyprenyl-3-methyl-5-hydroxy-6-metoxy-1,4-benzoquinol methylase
VRRLADASELLDGPLDERELAGNLRDLRRLNRGFGGAELSWRALLNVIRATTPGTGLRVLDVGTGAGDIPAELSRRARAAGRRVDFVATDVRPEIVSAARAAVRDANIEVRLAQRDLDDEADLSYDVVHASMVLHHLDPDEASRLLREFGRVSRSIVIINDLDRGWLWWIGAWLLSHLFTTNRYTRNDAPMSVRRAYTADELSDIAGTAGLREVARLRARPPYRYALTFVRKASR